METKICTFEENAISFVLDKENNMMVNATEMAKIFGKQVESFVRNESTKIFIDECLKNENSRFLNIETKDDLIISRQNSGTWMHRVLALKFAGWLNPKIELWVYSTIEKLLFGKHVEREKSFEKTLKLRNELDRLRDKPQKTGADFDRYLEIERELRHEQAVRKMLTRESIDEMGNLFKEEQD